MKKYIDRSISYTEYLALIDGLLADGKTTGPNQSESLFSYARLNRQRMWRLEKTIVLEPETAMMAAANDRKMIWLIVTEGWCGDAAQNIPVIEKIAAESAKIETRYILRDENPDLIDGFLTNGARAIPKLIALDADTLEVLGTWGARPLKAQQLFQELKDQGMEKSEIMERLQRWYNDDRARSLQAEFVDLIGAWEGILSVKAA